MRFFLFIAAACFISSVQAADAPKPVDHEALINEKLSKGVTPQNNACVLLWKAFGPKAEDSGVIHPLYFKTLGIESPPERGVYFQSLSMFAKVRLERTEEERKALKETLTKAMNRPWSRNEYPELADWLDANDKPLATIVEASKRSDYFSPILAVRMNGARASLYSANLPTLQVTRSAGAALCCRAMFKVKNGEAESAFADLMAVQRLARLVARGGSMTEAMMAVVIDLAAEESLISWLNSTNSTKLREHLGELLELASLPPLEATFQIERLMLLEVVDRLRVQGTGVLKHMMEAMEFTPNGEEREQLERVDFQSTVKTVNGMIDRCIAVVRLKGHDARMKEIEKLIDEVKARALSPWNEEVLTVLLRLGKTGAEIGDNIGKILMTMVFRSLEKIQNARDLTGQTRDNLLVAFALAAHKADHGEYPSTLDALAPKYLKAVPADLFTGKPLNYSTDGKSFRLYSAGANGKDDGGHADDIVVSHPLDKPKP